MKRARRLVTCLVLAADVSHAKQTDLFFDYSNKIRVSIPQKAKRKDEAMGNPQKNAIEKAEAQQIIKEIEGMVEKILQAVADEVTEVSHRTMTTSDLLSLSVELPNNASQVDSLIGDMVKHGWSIIAYAGVSANLGISTARLEVKGEGYAGTQSKQYGQPLYYDYDHDQSL